MNRLLSLIDTRLAQGLSLLCLLCATLFAAQAQAAPTIVSPASGTTLTAATVGQAIPSVTITATGGALPIDGWYECDIDDLFTAPPCLPPGLWLNNNSSQTTTLSGTPTTAGTYTFWISMNDGLNQAAKAQYTLVVSAAAPPVAGPVSATVAANSSDNPITLNFSSGAVTSVAVGSAPSHGRATTSGTSITYTPTPGYSGSDSFTYIGTNPSGASAAATVTLTVTPSTLSISPPSLPAGTAGSAYSQTLIATSGTAPYSYSVTAGTLPTGLSLSAAGVLSGTPTVAGTFNFTVTSTDQYIATGSRAYSLSIAAPTISVSPTTLSNITYATAYSQSLSASGGSGSYSYTYTGTLPAGLSLSSAGVISGTPTASGTYTLTITATDGNGFIGARAYTFTIAATTLTISPSTLGIASQGSGYSTTLSTSGGIAPYTYALTGGGLPPGINFSSAGVFSGTPTVANTYTFTIRSSDSNGVLTSRIYMLTVDPATIAVGPSALPSPVYGTSYTGQTLTASGGAAPYSFVVTSGAMPVGLSLASNGAISGTPTVPGSYSFTTTATDANSATGSRTYSVTVAAPTIGLTPTTLANGGAGSAYSQALSASGGVAPYTYAVTIGSLPTGLTLSSTGTLSGTPTVPGSASFTITAVDSNGQIGQRAYTLTITDQIPVAGPVSATVAANSPDNPITLNISGAMAASVAASSPSHGIVSVSGTTISYTPNAGYSGADSFAYTATGVGGTSAPATVSITVLPPNLAITPSTLPTPVYGISYTGQTLTASGGATPYSFVVTSGAMPVGLSLASNGAISGTPTVPGSYSFTTTATDANGATGSRSYSVTVAAPTIDLTPTTLANGGTGSAYSQALNASGGVAPYTYAVTIGSLPIGLTLSSTGTLSGTPTVPGSASFTITAADSNGHTGQRAYTMTIADQIPVAGPVSATVAANSPANPITLNISGATAASVAVSSSPSHGTASVSGTTISYMPSAGYSGVDSFAYTATGIGGTSAPATVSITVLPPTLAITPSTLPTPVYGISYTGQTLTASGGATPYSFAVTSGAMPVGLSLASNGAISGTPTAAGSYTFTISATDAFSATGSRSYSVTVAATTITLTPTTLVIGGTGSAYSQALSASGGVAPYTYAVTVGSLPAGLTLSNAGTLSGTPTAPGSASFTITASDNNGQTGQHAYTMTIADQSPVAGPVSATVAANSPANPITLNISGATAASVAVSSSPSHGTASVSGTTISYTPSAGYSGADSFAYTATGVGGTSAPATVSITVLSPTLAITPVTASLPGATQNAAYSQALATTGGSAPYSYSVTSGSLPAGLALSGNTVSGTPTATGTSTFTITVTDANSATGARTYTVAVAAPTITLTPTTLAIGGTGSAYSQALSASGGVAPYTYAVTVGSLPAGLTLSNAGTLSGTPTVPGNVNFTITASDNNGQTGQHAYTMTIADQSPVAGPVSATVAANSPANPITLNISGATAASVAVSSSPSHGTASVSGTTISYTPSAGYSGADSFAYTATGVGGTSAPATVSITVLSPTLAITPVTASLPGATQNAAYSQALATTGGSAPYSYSVTSGSLPAGLALSGNTVSGTPTATGTSTFTITVTDANGATSSRPYTLEVQAVPVVVPPSSENVLAGQTASVDLTRGATGGPFTSATLLTVSPASAGRARMSGPFTLSFAPAAAFAGSAVVTFSLQNASGSVATSFVTFAVDARPDPTKDAEVIGLLNAQSRAAERFASTQMDNFNRRLEQLHRPTCDRNSFDVTVRRDRDNVSLGSLGKALRDELEGNGKGRDEDDDEKRRQERDSSRATTGECREEALAFWTDGFVNTGSNRARGAEENSFTTYGLSAGMDYRLSPRAVVGIGFGYGNDRADIGEHDTRSEGDALGLAAYISVNPLSEVYIDALLGYNRISFDSRRYVTAAPSNGYAHGSRDADQLYASLTASYEYRQGPLSLAPYIRINSSYTKLDAYSERGGGAYALAYEEQDLRYFTSFVGLRTGYDIDTRFGVLTPRVGLAWGHNFSRNQDYRMRYADQGSDGVLYRLSPDPMDTNFMDLDTGLDLSLGRSWSMGFSYKTALGTNERNEMFRIGLDGKF